MRHRLRGRKLGRNSSHRKAMFRNMAVSLIRTLRSDDDAPNKPAVPGRIVTTVPKAKELRPIVEKLITLAKKAAPHEEAAKAFETTAAKNSAEWKSWRDSDQWRQWVEAVAPAVKCKRRAYDALRDREAVDILFSEIAPMYVEREGGYTRIVELPQRRLGDAGKQALVEFVGLGDRDRKRKAPMVVKSSAPAAAPAPVAVAPAEAPVAETTETSGE
ncbi:MAG: 50S ribosomal protein L17 [Planctomycetaceae bacterium]